jgi:hypothetical protein
VGGGTTELPQGTGPLLGDAGRAAAVAPRPRRSDVPHITVRVRPVPVRNVIVLTVGCR